MGIEHGEAMVYKHILIQYAKHPARLEGWLRNCGKAVKCKIVHDDSLPHDPPPSGKVWILLDKGKGGKSRFAIPIVHVYVRHRFIKPYIPLTALHLADRLEDILKDTGQAANTQYEEWRQQRADVLRT